MSSKPPPSKLAMIAIVATPTMAAPNQCMGDC